MAALVGANLAEFLQKALTKKFPATKVTLGSDSQIVLHWHQSNKQLQQFVCYQASLPTHQLAILPYKWQPGCPANKGCAVTTAQLRILVVWMHHPIWLPMEPDWPLWEPTTRLLVEITEEESNTKPEFDAKKRPTQVDSTDEQATISNTMEPTRHSTLDKLLSVTTYILRFVYNLWNPSDHQSGPPTVVELTAAEKAWLHDCQHHTYHPIARIEPP